jgi:hypothetical protein
MTCILYYIGHTLIALHCAPMLDTWIEPDQSRVVAYYLPRLPAWRFD